MLSKNLVLCQNPYQNVRGLTRIKDPTKIRGREHRENLLMLANHGALTLTNKQDPIDPWQPNSTHCSRHYKIYKICQDKKALLSRDSHKKL